MTASELLKLSAEENQTRKILLIYDEAVKNGESSEDIRKKIEALLKQ